MRVTQVLIVIGANSDRRTASRRLTTDSSSGSWNARCSAPSSGAVSRAKPRGCDDGVSPSHPPRLACDTYMRLQMRAGHAISGCVTRANSPATRLKWQIAGSSTSSLSTIHLQKAVPEKLTQVLKTQTQATGDILRKGNIFECKPHTLSTMVTRHSCAPLAYRGCSGEMVYPQAVICSGKRIEVHLQCQSWKFLQTSKLPFRKDIASMLCVVNLRKRNCFAGNICRSCLNAHGWVLEHSVIWCLSACGVVPLVQSADLGVVNAAR